LFIQEVGKIFVKAFQVLVPGFGCLLSEQLRAQFHSLALEIICHD